MRGPTLPTARPKEAVDLIGALSESLTLVELNHHMGNLMRDPCVHP